VFQLESIRGDQKVFKSGELQVLLTFKGGIPVEIECPAKVLNPEGGADLKVGILWVRANTSVHLFPFQEMHRAKLFPGRRSIRVPRKW
jgi:hypothetical protein